MTVSFASLVVQETKAAIYKTALAVADVIGLPVSSWQAGDPTRSLFHLESELLSTLEGIVVGYIKAGFLDWAAQAAVDDPSDPKAAMWLEVVAKQVFNVDVPPAVPAKTTVVLTNKLGGFYPAIEPGDLTLKNTTSGQTYTNTTGGDLASGSPVSWTTLSIEVEADVLGSAGSAGAGEIDELVTTLLGVSCSNPIAAVGVDKQDPATTVQQCRDKLDSLSPNGPKGAYSYVARNQALTGTAAVTRVRVFAESDTGDVTIYLAGPGGGVLESDRVLVEAAILLWSTPLCITPSVLAATNISIAITYELWVYKSCNKTADEVAADVLVALENMIASRPIGGDIIPPATSGALYQTMIESTIKATYPQAFRVLITSPAADTAIGNAQVATLGLVTANVHLVLDP